MSPEDKYEVQIEIEVMTIVAGDQPYVQLNVNLHACKNGRILSTQSVCCTDSHEKDAQIITMPFNISVLRELVRMEDL